MRLFPLVFALLLIAAGAASAADLAGTWKGTWTKDSDPLPVTVTFGDAGGAWSGQFDSDALQVSGIPFADIQATDGKVHWLLKGDQTSSVFDGTLTGDALAGTFVEGSTHGTFALARSGETAQTISSRDVTFANGAVTLAGTLLLPSTPGTHPAVVFLHGSGPEGRWANRYLAHKFVENGIAALIYDKRGVGQSTGDWRKAGFDALAGDALAGIRFLRTQAGVDPAKIGIYGHSQGGTFAPIVAARDGHLAFVIASAAGGIQPSDLERFSLMNEVGTAALPPAEQKDAWRYIDAVVGVAYRGQSRKSLDALAAKFKSRSWYFEPPPPEDSYWAISRKIAGFQPALWWQQVKCPVLLVYGGHDKRVPPGPSAKAIQSALFAGENFHAELKFYPNADHTFTIVDPPKQGGWPVHEPDYAAYLIAWTLKQM